MRAETILKYNARVPRYTSYPTAVQFSAEVDAERYRGWLAGLTDEALSVYLHVPFCRELCWYCGCNMRVVRRQSSHRRYVERLRWEIDLVRDATPTAGRIKHLHFGGGTPGILGAELLDEIVGALRQAFGFEKQAKLAIEIDPRGFTRELAEGLGRTGFTNASLGVQDLSPTVQKAINRLQTWQQTEDTATWLRQAGIAELNVDLMYGLPHQSEADVLNTVEQVLALAPERVALFGYAHVPWMKSHQRLIEDEALPLPDARLAMSEAAAAALSRAGYLRIGLDHFTRQDTSFAKTARAGRIRRNFQGYTDDPAAVLIGLGASAISDLGSGLAQNHTELRDYGQAIDAGRLATARGVARDDDDRLRGAVIESLMCRERADLAEICAAQGADLDTLAPALLHLQSFVDDGLLSIDGWTVRVLEPGRPIVRAVCGAFDRYLQASDTKHAIAV